MQIKSKHDIFAGLKSNADKIRNFGVVKIGVFGSYVKNLQTEQSDIDFFVEFDPQKKSYRNFSNLAFFLQDMFHKKVEIVTPQSLNRYFGHKILKEVEYVFLNQRLSLSYYG